MKTASGMPSIERRFEQIDDEQCHAFQATVELVGHRWSSGILLAVARGAHRFTQITEAIPGLSDRMLAQRLRELESADLVERQVVATTPVQVRYSLTARGRDLIQSLQPLVAWGQRWNNNSNTDGITEDGAPIADDGARFQGDELVARIGG